MAKSYTEELAAWVEKKAAKKRRLDATAVQFLAVKADVAAALQLGYSVTTIWEHMHEIKKVTCTYETFRKHVKRFIKETPKETPAKETPAAAQAAPAPAGSTREASGATSRKKSETPTAKGEAPKIGGFAFNPTPKKEDLL
jgi:hypothetical protein